MEHRVGVKAGQKKTISIQDPEWIRETLSAGNIGLWMVEIHQESGKILMTADDKMQSMLGLETQLDPEACFRYFKGRIAEGFYDTIIQYVEKMIQSRETIEIQYLWNHPVTGEVTMRCSGRLYDYSGGWIRVRGCQQNLSELEQYRLDNYLNQKQLRVIRKEKARYDALFQSVFCGIIEYSFEDNQIIFKNANKEAIFIWGYTEEEFWEHKSWRTEELVLPYQLEQNLTEHQKLRNIGDKTLLEYQLRTKDGGVRWTLGSVEIIRGIDNNLVYQGVFLDISQKKNVEEQNRLLTQQLRADQEMLRIALEHTTIAEFYYDLNTKQGHVPQRSRKLIGCGAEFEDMPVSFSGEYVEEEDIETYIDLYKRIHQGYRTATAEIKLKNKPVWQRVTLSVINYDENNNPITAVGIAEDISKQKEMEAALADARSRDSLTGLYKREAGLRMVSEFMEGKPAGQVSAVMIFDMDHFQKINDEEGTVFADVLLQEVADILKAEASPEDITIRLGGDEFMLFAKNCTKAEATIIGPKIADLVKNLFANDTRNIHISVSAGMCSTEVTDDLNTLLQCAESTLQYVKEHGKGTASCFMDASREIGTTLTQLYTEKLQINEISHSKDHYPEDVIPFALDLLGRTKNLDDAVSLLLSRIGRQFGLDRVSVVEIDMEYLSATFTYQWSRNLSDLLIGRCFYQGKEWFENLLSAYDEYGVAEYPSGMSKRLMENCLHAAIWNQGVYAGALAFEKRDGSYIWTNTERRQIKELAKLVSSYIMKVRADTVSQAKTDFLSRMSHEIRTPMNAIIGMTAIAKAVMSDKKKTMECLDKIETANAYLLSLLNDILDMSRIESGKQEINSSGMKIGDLLRNLNTILKQQAETKSIHFVISNNYEEDKTILADKLRLNQILVNILGNAFKFTEPGGQVVLCVSKLSERMKGVTLRFSVQDTGIGISKEQFGTIFNAFKQADRSTSAKYGGTGLGLSISSRLVQMMGGSLEVDSELGKGSDFHFTLAFPYADLEEEAKAEDEEYEEVTEFDFTGKRVLLAEDNELNREIAETLLSMNGFLVDSVTDGKQVVDSYLEHPPYYYDVIVTDIQMPNMDGLQAAKLIRTSGRESSRIIPIIAMSANAFDEDTRKSVESGMDGHLSKPIEVGKMLKAISKCMRQTARAVTQRLPE